MEENVKFCKLLPKIELHAHLNGSLRDISNMMLNTYFVMITSVHSIPYKPFPSAPIMRLNT